ncbi:MAG TPA: ABC transporter permease [Thermoanaerobaculia bacterium]|nr:ABC transporter permease [Thermoanaerobaculia bacterium]
MVRYNLKIAAKSLRRNPVLTAVIIGGIALGICISTTFTTVRHMFTRDPLPGKSQRLLYVRLDNWDKDNPYPASADSGNVHRVPPQITYKDAVELMRSPIPVRQFMSYVGRLAVFPDRRVSRPFIQRIRLTQADFFPMFDVPFQYGHSWDRRADANGEQVIVLDNAMNQRLFGGGNSVGKTLQIKDRNFTVVGVLAPWRPFIRMYDLVGNWAGPPDGIYMPFSVGPRMEIGPGGDTDTPSWGANINFNDYRTALMSEMNFVQLWVELRSPADRAAYQRYVDDYVLQQKKGGRFPRPLNNVVMSLRESMVDFGVIRPKLSAMAAISVLFLVICSLNLSGLVLGKFLARAPEVSVRRALGASRIDVFLQHIFECELVGIAGGAIGMLISVGVVRFIGKLISDTSVISLDAEMIASAILLSLVAGFVAGLYPAWRICSVQPAVQLKV